MHLLIQPRCSLLVLDRAGGVTRLFRLTMPTTATTAASAVPPSVSRGGSSDLSARRIRSVAHRDGAASATEGEGRAQGGAPALRHPGVLAVVSRRRRNSDEGSGNGRNSDVRSIFLTATLGSARW